MSDLTNPHDKFFKETFTRIEVARDFFANYLPQPVVDSLNLNTLALQSGSFIDTDLQEQFADLLYQVDLQEESTEDKTVYLYLLLEHKSYPDPHTPFQLPRYLVRIWERDVQDGSPLRPIIPTVVYHGREQWRVATDFRDLFTGKAVLQPYWPQFRYELQDECFCIMQKHPTRNPVITIILSRKKNNCGYIMFCVPFLHHVQSKPLATTKRPGLDEALTYLREGDVLVVWRLDRLGRSLPHLIETINLLEGKGIGF